MHISEGVLSPLVLGSGGVLTVIGTAIGLRKLDYEHLMRVAMLSAAFFVASLVHVPIGPSNVHLLLNGLLGILLGWAAFPAILIALLLQALLFFYGGLTVLGVNTFTVAFPAALLGQMLHPMLAASASKRTLAAFLAGFFSVAGSAILTTLALSFSDKGLIHSAEILLATHLPVMLIEGVITVFVVSFLAKVRPEILYDIKKRG